MCLNIHKNAAYSKEIILMKLHKHNQFNVNCNKEMFCRKNNETKTKRKNIFEKKNRKLHKMGCQRTKGTKNYI